MSTFRVYRRSWIGTKWTPVYTCNVCWAFYRTTCCYESFRVPCRICVPGWPQGDSAVQQDRVVLVGISACRNSHRVQCRQRRHGVVTGAGHHQPMSNPLGEHMAWPPSPWARPSQILVVLNKQNLGLSLRITVQQVPKTMGKITST